MSTECWPPALHGFCIQLELVNKLPHPADPSLHGWQWPFEQKKKKKKQQKNFSWESRLQTVWANPVGENRLLIRVHIQLWNENPKVLSHVMSHPGAALCINIHMYDQAKSFVPWEQH